MSAAADFLPHELQAQWVVDKNGTEPPPNQTTKVWWQGSCGHQWQASLTSRKLGRGCLICVGHQVLAGFNDLASTNVALAEQWHPIKNVCAADEVTAGSNSKAWWIGPCGHEWEAKIASRQLGRGCPYCAGPRVLVGFNDLGTTHSELANQWHPKLNSLTPQDISRGNKTKVWWKGPCGHEWESQVNSRAVSGQNCPICAGKKVLAGFNDLATTHPQIAAQWHPTLNAAGPESVNAGVNKKVWWRGPCGHDWDSSPNARVSGKQLCPFCAGKRVEVGFNDLASQSPEVSAQWHPTLNGDNKPTQFTVASNFKAWWLCEQGHEWQVRIATRKHHGCLTCQTAMYVSKAEQEIYEFVQSLVGDHKVEQSYRSLPGAKIKELDIYVPHLNVAVEYNGLYWHDADHKTNDYHYLKWLHCQQQGVQLFSIWEDSWLHNQAAAKAFLAHKLGFAMQPAVSAEATQAVQLDAAQADEFLETNHLLGSASGSVRVGLLHKQRLVSVAVFGSRGNGKWELKRYATTASPVTGGLSKSIAYLQTQREVSNIVVLDDNSQSHSELYLELGFQPAGELRPGYMYRKGTHRIAKAQFKNDPQLQWQEGKTEHQLAELNGLKRVYDAGKTRYLLTIQ